MSSEVCVFKKENAKTGRRSYAAFSEMGHGGERSLASCGGSSRRTGHRTADRLPAEPAAGRLGRDVRDLGRQERRKDRQGAEFLWCLRRENDGVTDVELGSVRRHLAQ